MTEETEQQSSWQNRIESYDPEVPAADLTAHPLNWRLHPDQQKEALGGVLAEIGWVQAVIVSKATGRILDGHARVSIAADAGETVPVQYVQVTEVEEAQILATFDPITGMADTDSEMLAALLQEVDQVILPESPIIEIMDNLHDLIEPPDDEELVSFYVKPDDPTEPVTECPKCSHRWIP